MAIQKRDKIKQLARLLPEGLLVDSAWMEKNSYSRALRSHYVSSGWLEQPVRSVYCRAHGKPGWKQVVISLQTLLGYPVSVGGRTALDEQGFAHYLYHKEQPVHLYTEEKLPGWLSKLPDCPPFVSHNRTRLFPSVKLDKSVLSLSREGKAMDNYSLPGSLQVEDWGQWKWPLVMSAPERAILEVLDELPDHETFHRIDKYMESLVNLRPRRLQSLLEETKSVKVKRLFFYFADRHNHKWCAHLNRDKINLGAGKRVIYKGGKLDKTYQITVPEDMDAL